MITALEGFFLIILASVSFRISHIVVLCILSNFGLNPVRAAWAGYDTPQTLCTTEVPFSSSSLQRERFHSGFWWLHQHCSAVVGWWGGPAGRAERSPQCCLAHTWLFSVFCFEFLLPVPAARFPASGLCSGQNQKTEKTHTRTHTYKKVTTALLVIPRALTFLPFTSYCLLFRICELLVFVFYPTVFSVIQWQR